MIQTREQVLAALVDLYGATLDYTHSNVGEDLHRSAYREIDQLTHDLAFWVGGPDEVRSVIEGGKGRYGTS